MLPIIRTPLLCQLWKMKLIQVFYFKKISSGWSKQCNKVVNTTNKILGMIKRRTFTYLDVDGFVQIYKSLVRPHIGYCIQVWRPYLQKDVDALETRKPTSWWGSAKRDVTHPTATVVYNTKYLLLLVPKTFMHYHASTSMGKLTATTIRHQPFM